METGTEKGTLLTRLNNSAWFGLFGLSRLSGLFGLSSLSGLFRPFGLSGLFRLSGLFGFLSFLSYLGLLSLPDLWALSGKSCLSRTDDVYFVGSAFLDK